MSSDGQDEFHWRETYFILFDSRKRPQLEKVEYTLSKLSRGYRLSNGRSDEDGLFESVTLAAPEDNAALEISFESGEAVTEQGTELAKQLKSEAGPEQLRLLMKADARLDIMHFEQIHNDYGDFDEEEMLDPSCLLMVVEALVELTDGVPVDPASGAILP